MANFLTKALRDYNIGGLGDYQSRTPMEQTDKWGRSVAGRRNTPNQMAQNLAASNEHMEFAREVVGGGGPLDYASMLAVIPAYELAKATERGTTLLPDNSGGFMMRQPAPLIGGRSDPSIESLVSGYRGANQGLADWWKRL